MRGAAAAVALLGALGIVVSPLASCSDDPPAAGPPVDAGPDGPPPLTAEAAAFVNDLCALHQPCCASIPGAASTCVARTSTFARGKTFDAVRARECLEAVRAESRVVGYCGRGPEGVACAGVFKDVGARAPGASCRTTSECANAVDAEGVCVASGAGARCRQVRRGKEGDACVGTRALGSTVVPEPPPAEGAALCFVADGLLCDPATTKCVRRGAVGAACTDAPGACVDAAFCSAGKACTARVAKGGKCSVPDACAAGSVCSGGADGTCVAVLGEGGACIRGDECDPAASLVCDRNVTKCIPDTTVYERTCSGAAALLRD
jgi:hypothetical protein